MENKWTGIEIIDKLTVKNINLILGIKSVIVVPDLKNTDDYLNLFAILKFFFSKLKIEIESVFGVFLDKTLCVIKKKSRKEFYMNFSHERLLSLLEGENVEAYYTEKNNLEKLIGVEIRLNIEIKDYLRKERVFGELNIFIDKEKKKILNEE